MKFSKYIKNNFRLLLAYLHLSGKYSVDLKTANLRRQYSKDQIAELFKEGVIDLKWEEAKSRTAQLNLPEGMDGVNLGDQKALFYIVSHFAPKSVLEIGTHIGCSTVHIALALDLIRHNNDFYFETVDIRDVNDDELKPWLSFNSPASPADNLKKIGLIDKVKFHTNNSVDFLALSESKYDLIFLDGLHEAGTLFNELPLAIDLLNPNGVILLHDYFPDNLPLWQDGNLIPGPYLAVKKMIKGNNNLVVSPLGDLPWFTKQNSYKTSLALCFSK